MKKLLSFIAVILMTFVLFACGETKITVSFDANGGSEVAKIEVSLDDLSKFALPEAPVKQGYEFKGWFLDPEFKSEFKSINDVKESITLYAKWEEVKNKFEVSFETNGGDAIAKQTVNENETVTEPTAPLKEGYVFVGWFTDEELTKEYDFNTKVTGNLVLYAKWEKAPFEMPTQVKGQYSLNAKVNLKSGAGEELNATLKIATEFAAKHIDTESLENAEGMVKLTVGASVDTLSFAQEYTVTMYVKDGMFYASIPNSLIQIIMGALSEGEEDPVEETYTNFYLKMEDVALAVKAVILAKLPASSENPDEEIDFTAEMEKIYATLMEILGKAKDYGIDDKMLTALQDMVKILEPKETKDETKTVYEITDLQFKTFIASLSSFIASYAPKLVEYVYDMGIQYMPVQDKEYEDLEGNVFVSGVNGWTDNDGVSHLYSEDKDYKYGFINAFGYYESYAFGQCFDVNNDYAFVNAIPVQAFEQGPEDLACLYFPEDDKYLIKTETGTREIKVSEDFEIEKYGFVTDEGYYQMRTTDQIFYNVATGKKATEKEVVMAKAQNIITQINVALGAASGLFKVNKFAHEVANDGSSTSFTFDISVNVPKSITGGEEDLKIDGVIEFNTTESISFDDFTIEYPSFEGWFDWTELIKAVIASSLL